MRETRINLKHLLEDIRDSYPIPLEEVILVELVANALDSDASFISFFSDPAKNTLTVVDNGRGMRRDVLSDYHNIAATTKLKGKGIGFAGIGAKLSLLIADLVITETKGGYGSRCATEWHLRSETSAPWKFVPFSGKVPYPRGTAVSIVLSTQNYPLLDEDFIVKTIERQYYPLFHPELFQLILKHIYKKGVEFFINNKKISFSHGPSFKPRIFQLKIGGRSKRLAGTGYLAKSEHPADLVVPGFGVSTFGKMIKSGWEWLGISTREDRQISGMLEIPALAEILTTNKMDFLKDATSLKKYYSYRKAIQETVLPILEEFGEEINAQIRQKQFRSLTTEIERALRQVLGNFPELVPLLGIRRLKKTGPSFQSIESRLVGMIEEPALQEKGEGEIQAEKEKGLSSERPSMGSVDPSKPKKGKKGPALSIGFEKRKEDDPLARMVEDEIWVNTEHPAYFKAKEQGLEQYHILFCVGWVLSHFLEDNRSPQAFIDNFLASWGKGERKNLRLLEI